MAERDATALPAPPSDEYQGEVSLRNLFELLSTHWLAVLVFVVGGSLLGGVYSLFAPRIFSADGLLQVEENDKGGSVQSSMNALSQFLTNSPVETEAEIQILQSRMILSQVIQKLNLLVEARPRLFPVIGRPVVRAHRNATAPSAPFLGLSRYAWGGEQLELGRLDVPSQLLGKHLILVAQGKSFSISYDGVVVCRGDVGESASGTSQYGVVSTFVRSLSARPGTEFLLRKRTEADVIDDLHKHLAVAESGNQSGVIRVQFSAASGGFAAEVINSIESAYILQNVERHSEEAMHSLDFLEKQIPALKRQLDEAQSKLNEYQVRRGSVDVSQETQLVLQQSADLQSQLLDLNQQREQQLQRFTSQHPAIIALDRQIDAIHQRQQALHGQENNLPSTQQEILGLLRDVDSTASLYTEVLNSIQQLQVVKAGTVGNVRIIDKALVPDSPALPKVSLIISLTTFMGLLGGIAFVLLRSALVHGVEDPSEIERKLRLNTFAVIPFAREQRRLMLEMRHATAGTHVLAVADPLSPAIEAVRGLRTSLHFALMESGGNVVMFTGPAPNLGKSFVTVNLSAVLCQSGKKVLLIDADLRRGRLHRSLALQASPGLSDMVSRNLPADGVIQHTEIDGLDFLAAGAHTRNPAEVLLHSRFAAFVKEAAQRYDYVLIDTPPVLAVTDAAIIGTFVSCTLLVLKSAQHPVREIEDCVRRLRQATIGVSGVVLNQVGRKTKGYGYTYGSTYSSYRRYEALR